jgi:hypothetical protein
MTPATDDDALGAAFEALLAGRSAPPAAGGLAAFTDGVRATAARPPRPNAALAELLATGLLTDQSSVPAPAAAARSRRRRSPMFLSSILGKLASLGLLAKTGAVAGVLVVGVSTAGFTENLPAPMQTTWDHVVAHDDTATTPSGPTDTTSGDTTSGTDAKTGATDTQTGTGTPTDGSGGQATGTGGTGTTVTSTTGGTATQPAPTGNGLGSQVAGKVDHGYVTVDGKQERVSDLAHDRNSKRREGTSSGTSTGTSTGTTDGSNEDGGTATGGTSGDSSSTSGTETEDGGSTGSKGSHGSGHSHG